MKTVVIKTPEVEQVVSRVGAISLSLFDAAFSGTATNLGRCRVDGATANTIRETRKIRSTSGTEDLAVCKRRAGLDD
jgi:hypothetical protein